MAEGASAEKATRLALADFQSDEMLAQRMASLRQAQATVCHRQRPPPDNDHSLRSSAAALIFVMNRYFVSRYQGVKQCRSIPAPSV